MTNLKVIGWDDARGEEHTRIGMPEFSPARVVSASRGHYQLLGFGDPVWATLRGRIKDGEAGAISRPTVGDWVLAGRTGDDAVIEHCMERRTAFVRKTAGRGSEAQIVAANLDRVFAVTAIGRDLNLRRIERYLTAIWDSGAEPVIVVNKTDLPHDPQAITEEIETVALGVTIVLISAEAVQGLEGLLALCVPGQTIALVGSSGVGKSTIVNRLLGRDLQTTSPVREGDHKGRHTTSSRELFVTDSGVVLIDTPGMRELGLLDAEDGLERTFADLIALASGCRFRDCTHTSEAECAIIRAVEQGEVDPKRLDSYHRQQRELAFNARRAEQGAKENSKKRWKWIETAKRERAKIHDKSGLK